MSWSRIPGNCCRPIIAATGRAPHCRRRRRLRHPLSLGAVSIDPNRCRPPPLTTVDLGLPRSPLSLAEVLGTGSIPSKLAEILAEQSRSVRKDGTARTQNERTCRGMYASLLHLTLGEVPVPELERITLIGIDADGRVHLMHSLLSVLVNVYSTECHLFACLYKLPAQGLPPVTEISPDFFAARRSVCAVLLMDHIAHLGGISPRDWETKP